MEEYKGPAPDELDGELALRQERSAVELLVEQTSDACAILDAAPSGAPTLRHVSPRLARWLGHASGARLAGEPASALVVEADRPVLAALLAAAIDGAATSSAVVECRFLHAGGKPLPARVTVTRAGAGPSAAILLRVEIGEARQGGLLRVLETAVDHLDDIVFITEAEPRQGGRRVVFVNRAFTEITGYRPEEVLGQTPSMTVGPATDRAVLRRIEARLKARRSVHEELLKYRKDGTCYWVELDIVPVFDDEGTHTHWVSVQRDVTDRKSRELRALESERRAAVGAAVGRVDSELRAPLLRVRSSLERATAQLARLGDGGLPEITLGEHVGRISAMLASARDQTKHLAETMSEVTRGAISADPVAEIDVREALETSLALVRKQIQRTAKVERAFAPTPRVCGSAATLGRVFAHLLMNAIEALPPENAGQNRIRVSTRVDHAGWVVAEVEDNGPGIPPEIRDRVFLPFFTTKPVDAHEGLGLAHALAAVRAIHGSLEFESHPGRGTTFRVILPAAGGLETLSTPPPAPANDG